MDRRIDRGQATRRHVIDEATRLFAARGYEAVSTEALLESCGVSRGALYHHFASKEAVFTAVLEATEERIVAQLSAASANTPDPVAALRKGCMAWLNLAAEDAVVRRVVLTDAPTVIGWQAWRALDERYTLGLIRTALSAAAADGLMKEDRVEIVAHMLLAVLVEVALLIARTPDDPSIARRGREAVKEFLDGMFLNRLHRIKKRR